MARNSQQDKSRSERGRKGGQATARTHGKDFYQTIGSEGGKKAQQTGAAHQLTREERARGGRNSSSND